MFLLLLLLLLILPPLPAPPPLPTTFSAVATLPEHQICPRHLSSPLPEGMGSAKPRGAACHAAEAPTKSLPAHCPPGASDQTEPPRSKARPLILPGLGLVLITCGCSYRHDASFSDRPQRCFGHMGDRAGMEPCDRASATDVRELLPSGRVSACPSLPQLSKVVRQHAGALKRRPPSEKLAVQSNERACQRNGSPPRKNLGNVCVLLPSLCPLGLKSTSDCVPIIYLGVNSLLLFGARLSADQ